MSAMDPQRDTAGSQGEGVEYVKVAKNTKAYNWDYKVIRKPEQTWKDVLAEIDELEYELAKRYGGQ